MTMKMRFVLPIFAAVLVSTAAAEAATAYTTERLTLRAGPGGDYPRIDSVSRNTRVTVHGCVNGFNWCDISRGRMRGWVDGDELVVPFRGRRIELEDYSRRGQLPIISFRFDNYWDRHYRRASFYRDRDTWRERWRGWSGPRDQDRDGIANRFDRDQDGDGIREGRDRDRDNDGVNNRRDRNPDNPARR
jgi:uncharacterized protein YraI